MKKMPQISIFLIAENLPWYLCVLSFHVWEDELFAKNFFSILWFISVA